MIRWFLHIAISVLFCCEISYSQYTIIPTNTTGLIRSIQKSGDYFLLCGKDNFLAKYRISSEELIPLTTNLEPPFGQFHIQMLDTNTFYTTGFVPSFPYQARIIRTIDGGQTWENILDTVSELFYINRLLVFDTNRIVLLSTGGKSFVSNDGGAHWALHTPNLPPICSTSLRVNDSCAIIGTNNSFATSQDKAQSWQGQWGTGEATCFSAKTLDSIYLVSSGTGGYFGYVFRQSETKVFKPMIFDPKGIYAFSKNEIYVTGSGGHIAKTTDLGNTWSYFQIPEANYLYDINFMNDSIALIGGNNGILVRWNKHSNFSNLSINETSPISTSISITPNPSDKQQSIQFHNPIKGKVSVNIVDLKGKILKEVFTGTLNTDEAKISVDITSLTPGMYQYQIQFESETVLKRFIKL